MVDDPLVVSVPHDAPADVMNALRLIFLSHPGEHAVELRLVQGADVRRIRLPMGVGFDSGIMEQLEALFQREKIG